jgi:hypothetical protein
VVFMMNKTLAALLALALVTLVGTASADPIVAKSAKVLNVNKKPAKQMVCHVETLQQGSGVVKVCVWK